MGKYVYCWNWSILFSNAGLKYPKWTLGRWWLKDDYLLYQRSNCWVFNYGHACQFCLYLLAEGTYQLSWPLSWQTLVKGNDAVKNLMIYVIDEDTRIDFVDRFPSPTIYPFQRARNCLKTAEGASYRWLQIDQTAGNPRTDHRLAERGCPGLPVIRQCDSVLSVWLVKVKRDEITKPLLTGNVSSLQLLCNSFPIHDWRRG